MKIKALACIAWLLLSGCDQAPAPEDSFAGLGSDAAGLTGRLGVLEGIAIGCRPIAGKLATNGVGTAPEQAGNGSLAPALLQKRSNREAIFWLQVRVS
mgnify:CR=1 FL=1